MKKAKILLIVGIFSCSLSQIASHYLNIDDSIKGLGIGFGIGVLLVALFQFKKSFDIGTSII